MCFLTFQLEIRGLICIDVGGDESSCVSVDDFIGLIKSHPWEGEGSISVRLRFIAVHREDLGKDILLRRDHFSHAYVRFHGICL